MAWFVICRASTSATPAPGRGTILGSELAGRAHFTRNSSSCHHQTTLVLVEFRSEILKTLKASSSGERPDVSSNDSSSDRSRRVQDISMMTNILLAVVFTVAIGAGTDAMPAIPALDQHSLFSMLQQAPPVVSNITKYRSYKVHAMNILF